MTTYNVATESAEKQAVRASSKGGASAIAERGVYTLLPPTSGSSTAAVTESHTTSGGTIPASATGYFYYVTGVTNGVESFSNPVVQTTAFTGSTSSATFTIVDNVVNPAEHLPATSFKLYVGTTAANATLQTTSGTTTLAWTAYTTNGVLYSNSPAMISYPQSSGTAAYSAPNWVGDALVHNPNNTTGYSGFPINGEVTQVRQIRTSIVENQVYSRTDTATVTSGSGTVSDSSITWSDFGKPVTGTGIPTNSFVGNVTSGTSFVLSSVQGQNVPYYPGTTTAFNATANGTSITVSGSNVGPIPVQLGQYRTTRWQG